VSKQLRRQIVPNLIHPRRGLAIRCGPLANGQAYQATKAAKPGVVAERTHFLTRRVVGSLGVQTVPSSEDFRRYGRLSVRRRLPLWRLRLARLRRLWLRRLRLLLVMGTLPHLLRALLQSPGAITAAGLVRVTVKPEVVFEVTDVLHAWLGSTLT
jgi:hypothetical protein